MLAPTAQLRVFLPLDAYPAHLRRRWESYVDQGRGLTRREAIDQRRRLAEGLAVGRLREDVLGDALVRRVDGRRMVCPLDLDRRAAATFRRLQEELPERVVLSLVPDEVTRRRLQRLAVGGGPRQIREHAWSVPLAWYLAFSPEEQRRTEPAEGQGPSVRFLTSVEAATRRLERVFDALVGEVELEIEAGPADVDDLLTWLSQFDDAGILELDYGRLAADLPAAQDHACRDLWRAVEAFEQGDVFDAAVAYGVAQSCWAGLALRATAS